MDRYAQPASQPAHVKVLLAPAFVDSSSVRGVPPQLEQAWPPFEDKNLPEEWSFLPFVALPDGVHAVMEEFIYFHLPPTSHISSTTFGLSCYRQMPTSEVQNKSLDMTRSSIQKAIVVLASKPILFGIKEKLGIITETFFNQKDFTNSEILTMFYDNINYNLTPILESPLSSDLVMQGLSVHSFLQKFKSGVLKLLKAVLIGKKVLFYGHHVEMVTSFQYALVSLIPDALLHLQSTSCVHLEADNPLFGKKSVWLPYVPLQQIEVLFESNSYLVGTSNALFLQHKGCTPDVVANVEDGTIDINSSSNAVLALSAADRKWIQDIVDDAHTRSTCNDYDTDTRNKFARYVNGISDGSEYNQSWVNAYKLKWEIQGFGHPSFIPTMFHSIKHKISEAALSISGKKSDVSHSPSKSDTFKASSPAQENPNEKDDYEVKYELVSTNSLRSLFFDPQPNPQFDI